MEGELKINRYQKSIDNTAWVMQNVSYIILMNDRQIVGDYDYDQYSLFRLCRIKLKQLIKENSYSMEDIKNLRGSLYKEVTVPLCKDIVEGYAKYIDKLNKGVC
jgi:hypothetical protein